MEFFSRVHEQTAERFRSLAPNTRLASIAAILLILAGALFLVPWQSDDVYEPLFDSRTFPMGEIARMTTAFKEAGLNDARVVRKQILVPGTEKIAYLVALNEADALPADIDDSVKDAIAKDSIFEPRYQSDKRHEDAERTKLERMIAALDGIESAFVRYDEEKRGGFPRTTEASAMVAVQAADDRHLEYEQIDTVRDIVAGHFVVLEREDVDVVDLNASEAYPGNRSITSRYALTATKRMLEREFRAKIEERLSIYPSVKVGVNVHLAAPDNPVASFTTMLVTASIDLPNSYFKTICLRRHPTSEGSRPDPTALANIEQEIKRNVEQAVTALLPPPAPGLNQGTQVFVTSYEDTLAESSDSPSPSTTQLSRITHWQLAAFVLAILFGLSIYFGQRRQLRRARGETAAVDPPTTVPVPTQRDSQGDRGDADPNQRHELSRLIEQDPGAAAEVITEWLRRKDAA